MLVTESQLVNQKFFFFLKNVNIVSFLYWDFFLKNLNKYFFLKKKPKIKFFLKNSFFFKKKGKKKPPYFFFLKKNNVSFFFKKNKILTKSVLNSFFFKRNKNLRLSNNKKILFFKRKLGLLKYRFNDRMYLLKKANYLLDLKKKRFSKKNVNLVSNFANEYRTVKKRRKWIFRYHSISKKNFTQFHLKKIRNNLSKFIPYKMLNQTKKSKVIYSLYNKSFSSQMNLDNILWNFLLKLQIMFSKNGSFNYISSVGVFINGSLVDNPNFFLKPGDVIQFHNNKHIYKYISNIRKKKYKFFKKVKPRLFRLMRHKIDPHKQPAKHIPKFVNNFYDYKFSKPSNIEYDFYTLTFMYIYDNKQYNNINHQNMIYRSIYLQRLYNWKYIV